MLQILSIEKATHEQISVQFQDTLTVILQPTEILLEPYASLKVQSRWHLFPERYWSSSPHCGGPSVLGGLTLPSHLLGNLQRMPLILT